MYEPANLIGATLGNYQIQALLGSGGMANVYRALDQRLGRLVALKVLLASIAAQPGFVDRFLQEARLIAQLRHPNIVQIYDFGQHDGLWYMVQELLAGPTLEQQLQAAQGQPLPRAEVIDIVRQLAAALDAAHAAGVVHRDVKPANAIWNTGGTLVLTDFGIAKNTQLSSNHTQTGVVIGTPSYISPEGAQGQPPTASSDIYSLGVVLYELLAGKLPFSNATPFGAVLGHLQDAPPPLSSSRPDLPFAVERVVLQALAKDPAARFRSASALAAALEAAWPAGVAPGSGADALPHERPTQIWERPQPVTPPPVPQPLAGPQPRQPAVAAKPAPRAGVPGVFIGLVLAALAVAALVMLGRGAGGPGSPEPPASALESTAASAAPEPTVAPEPSAVPAPTEAPPSSEAPQPTAVPAPTEAPAPSAPPAPTEAPAPNPAQLDRSVEQLRALLLDGLADGRAGKNADQLLETFDKASQALLGEDKKRAADRLRDLQKRLVEHRREDSIDAAFAQAALDGIDAIARQYDLKLPQVKPPKSD